MCGTELVHAATAVCDTELVYAATAVCGTELAYGATRTLLWRQSQLVPALQSSSYEPAMRCPGMVVPGLHMLVTLVHVDQVYFLHPTPYALRPTP
eukprot:1437568-Rhodomonas_salina.1